MAIKITLHDYDKQAQAIAQAVARQERLARMQALLNDLLRNLAKVPAVTK